MRILSVDVGIRNFAYCYVEMDEKGINVLEWKNIDLFENDPDTLTIEHISERLFSVLMSLFPENDFIADIVLIEIQIAKNNKMKVVSDLLYGYFMYHRLRGSSIGKVNFVPASHKYKVNKSPGYQRRTYAERKRLSIHLIEQYLDQPDFIRFSCTNEFEVSRKCDDLSDAMLFVIRYFETSMPPRIF